MISTWWSILRTVTNCAAWIQLGRNEICSALHSRKYGPGSASCKVALFSERFNHHRLKCSVHHATFHEASSLFAFFTVLWWAHLKPSNKDLQKANLSKSCRRLLSFDCNFDLLLLGWNKIFIFYIVWACSFKIHFLKMRLISCSSKIT